MHPATCGGEREFPSVLTCNDVKPDESCTIAGQASCFRGRSVFPLEELPFDVFIKVSEYLDIGSIDNLSLVSKRINASVREIPQSQIDKMLTREMPAKFNKTVDRLKQNKDDYYFHFSDRFGNIESWHRRPLSPVVSLYKCHKLMTKSIYFELKCRATLTHAGQAEGMHPVFSPDSRYLITCSCEGIGFQLYDRQFSGEWVKGQFIPSKMFNNRIMAFDPTGYMVVTDFTDRFIFKLFQENYKKREWSFISETPLASSIASLLYPKFGDYRVFLRDCECMDNHKLLVFCASKNAATTAYFIGLPQQGSDSIILQNAETGSEGIPIASRNLVDVTGDGSYFCSASPDAKSFKIYAIKKESGVCVWEEVTVENWACSHGSRIKSISFSSDGDKLLIVSKPTWGSSNCNDAGVWVLDLDKNWTRRFNLKSVMRQFHSAVFKDDATSIIVTQKGECGKTLIWDLKSADNHTWVVPDGPITIPLAEFECKAFSQYSYGAYTYTNPWDFSRRAFIFKQSGNSLWLENCNVESEIEGRVFSAPPQYVKLSPDGHCAILSTSDNRSSGLNYHKGAIVEIQPQVSPLTSPENAKPLTSPENAKPLTSPENADKSWQYCTLL